MSQFLQGHSPVYTHIVATIQGMVSIRAFGNEKKCIGTFNNHMNRYTMMQHLFVSAGRAYSVALDLVVFTLCAGCAIIAVLTANSGD